MLGELSEKYLEYGSVAMTERSVVQYRNALSRLQEWLQKHGVKSWKAVTPAQLSDYRVYLSRQPGKRGGTISECTRLQRAAIIRAFFNYLRDIHGIDNRSAVLAFPDLTPHNEPETKPLTPEELEILWTTCRKDLLVYAIVATMFFTGIRHTEVITCPLTGLSIKDGEITLRGKGGKIRTVLITTECADILTNYLEWRGKVVREGVTTLFVTKYGKPLTYNQLSYIFVRLKKVIPGIHPHKLRHTFASYMIRTGSDIKTVQILLGHRRIDTTGRYLHTTTEQMKQAHQKLSEFIK